MSTAVRVTSGTRRPTERGVVSLPLLPAKQPAYAMIGLRSEDYSGRPDAPEH
jgi:hypothetical protein